MVDNVNIIKMLSSSNHDDISVAIGLINEHYEGGCSRFFEHNFKPLRKYYYIWGSSLYSLKDPFYGAGVVEIDRECWEVWYKSYYSNEQ